MIQRARASRKTETQPSDDNTKTQSVRDNEEQALVQIQPQQRTQAEAAVGTR